MKINVAVICIMFVFWQFWSPSKDQLAKQSAEYMDEHKQVILRFYGDSSVPKIVLRPLIQGLNLQEREKTSVQFSIANLSQIPVDLKFEIMVRPVQNFVNWSGLEPLHLEAFAEDRITLILENTRPLVGAPQTIELTLKTIQTNS